MLAEEKYDAYLMSPVVNMISQEHISLGKYKRKFAEFIHL
jgi:hypothetical protein